MFFFSLLKRKAATVRPFEVWGGFPRFGEWMMRGSKVEGDSEEKLFWRGPVRKYVPNACFWELLVWYGVICGRFGVILVRLECRITVSVLYVMCCLIPILLEYLAANSGINEIWFAKAAFYLWQWSMLWWRTKWKAWTTFCVISSVSRCGKNFLYKKKPIYSLHLHMALLSQTKTLY